MRRLGWIQLVVLVGIALVSGACSSSSHAASGPSSTTTTAHAAASTSTTASATTGTKGSFCSDLANAKAELLTWTTSTPDSAAAAAEPLAHAFATIAAEAPASVKSQADDLASTFVQLEKYDQATDPNVLMQESPLTNGHVTPDSNALETYAQAHC